MGSAGIVFSDSHYIIKRRNKKAKDFRGEKVFGRSKDGSGLATPPSADC